jgi:Chlorophyll A-B binding protein
LFSSEFICHGNDVTLINLSLQTIGVRTMQAKKDEAQFGFTPSAEVLNGRLAMIGFVAALVTELVTGQGTLHFLGLM